MLVNDSYILFCLAAKIIPSFGPIKICTHHLQLSELVKSFPRCSRWMWKQPAGVRPCCTYSSWWWICAAVKVKRPSWGSNKWNPFWRKVCVCVGGGGVQSLFSKHLKNNSGLTETRGVRRGFHTGRHGDVCLLRWRRPPQSNHPLRVIELPAFAQ